MNTLKKSLLAIAAIIVAGTPLVSKAQAQSKGKVLVIMSSANELTLKDGKQYKTGYYLNEFEIPYKKLVDAGYTPVIANPKGDMPVMDANSNNKMFFGGDDAARAEALKYVETVQQLKHPKTLASVVSDGTDAYVGLFIPGGHAPMVDLIQDKNVGQILTSFHTAGRTTGIICHGPVVLLSTLNDPQAFQKALIAGDGSASSLAKNWPYAGYHVTIFSTGEEEALEGPKGLGGYVQFYPVNALAEAGAHVDTFTNWHPNVVVDRELITGQQPMSAEEFGNTFISKLNNSSN